MGACVAGAEIGSAGLAVITLRVGFAAVVRRSRHTGSRDTGQALPTTAAGLIGRAIAVVVLAITLLGCLAVDRRVGRRTIQQVRFAVLVGVGSRAGSVFFGAGAGQRAGLAASITGGTSLGYTGCQGVGNGGGNGRAGNRTGTSTLGGSPRLATQTSNAALNLGVVALARAGVTAVLGAQIAVIAGLGHTGTATTQTLVTGRAAVLVVTGCAVGSGGAAAFRNGLSLGGQCQRNRGTGATTRSRAQAADLLGW